MIEKIDENSLYIENAINDLEKYVQISHVQLREIHELKRKLMLEKHEKEDFKNEIRIFINTSTRRNPIKKYKKYKNLIKLIK